VGSGDAGRLGAQRAHVFRENRRNLKGTNGSACDMMFNRCTMADTSARIAAEQQFEGVLNTCARGQRKVGLGRALQAQQNAAFSALVKETVRLSALGDR
jgi:hypothetical protein